MYLSRYFTQIKSLKEVEKLENYFLILQEESFSVYHPKEGHGYPEYNSQHVHTNIYYTTDINNIIRYYKELQINNYSKKEVIQILNVNKTIKPIISVEVTI